MNIYLININIYKSINLYLQVYWIFVNIRFYKYLFFTIYIHYIPDSFYHVYCIYAITTTLIVY